MSSQQFITSLELKNYLFNDPLLDWLDLYGHLHNYYPDKNEPDKIFNNFIINHHSLFRKEVLNHINQQIPINYIKSNFDTRKRISDTLDCLYLGKKIIVDGALFSEKHTLIGSPDILVRGDCLDSLFPDCEISPEESKGKFRWTYYIINIELLKLHLNKEEHIQNTNKRYQYVKSKNIIDTICLNEILETNYSLSFIISKSVKLDSVSEKKNKKNNFYYGKVDYQTYDNQLYQKIFKGCQWRQNLSENGSKWSLKNKQLYCQELYPNMVNHDDYPWGSVKKKIASQINEITLLYQCGIKQRQHAFQNGYYQWNDCDSTSLKISNTKNSKIINKMIELNKFELGIQFSPRILKNHTNLKQLKQESIEFFVDFETVINFDETCLECENHNLLFMIGCLCIYTDKYHQKHTQFKQFTCSNLNEEFQIINSWISYMNVMTRKFKQQQHFKIYHWSQAEPVIMKKMKQKYSNQDLLPSQYQWSDLLNIFKNEPIILKDVFSYSLKPVVKKLHQLGLIKTTWPQSEVMDGKNAMIFAWLYYTNKDSQPSNIMNQIEKYNFIDCQVLSEITSFLRTKL